jgi:hypothetical protein
MSNDASNPRDSPDESVSSAERVAENGAKNNPANTDVTQPVAALAALPVESGDTQSEEGSGKSVVASPVPTVVEPPPAEFLRLKEYCDRQGLKSTIETEPPCVVVEFKNGRVTRSVFIGSEEAADALQAYPLGDLVFLGDYSAICSYKEGWIEAAVRAHGAGPRRFIARRSIFGIAAIRRGEPAEIEISGDGGPTLRLTEKRGLLYLLDYISPITLRIEGIGITEHDKAVSLLEDLSNSLFMQIDFRFDSPLALGRDRPPSRRSLASRGQLDEDNQLAYPRFSYERGPSSLYWYARSATSMPLLQFLAFYQCIEFFFPQFSRSETIAKIKNVLKDPAFNWTKDSDINVILNATLEGRRGILLEERKQLGVALRQCVDAVGLRDFLNETEERKRYYGSEYKKISDKRISLSDESAIVEQTAERIYDIRCKVVHTKNLEGGESGEMILPFSEEADLLMDDVDLIKFLARKVLIASSGPLKT